MEYAEQADVLRIEMLSHNSRNACAKVALLSRHISAQLRINHRLRTPLPASTFSNVNVLYLEKSSIPWKSKTTSGNDRPYKLRKLNTR